MKLKLSLLFIFFSSLSLAAKPIILWDIHDVLAEPQDRIVTFFRFPYFKELASRVSWPFIKDLVGLITKNLLSEDVSSEQYIHLALQHNNPYLAELIVRVANSQKPIVGMKEIVQELDQLGYDQHIGSNIGFIAFHRLINPEKHPQLGPIFKPMDIRKSVVVNNDHGRFIRKPDPRFFKRYLKKNNIDLTKTPVIFIDDKPENSRAARAVGLDAIRFKNPRQLREELIKRGVKVRAPKYRYSNQQDQHKLYDPALFSKSIYKKRPS